MFVEYLPILATVAICLFARPLGEWLAVIDHPDSDRKIHSGPTPQVGGIAVIAPIAIWAISGLLWGSGADSGFYFAILLCGSGVAIVGFMDDQHTTSAGGRLLLLAIFSVVALRLDPVLASNQVHFAAWGWFPLPPLLLPALSVTALAGFSSAVNMTDGLDGLVLALICIWSLCLVILGTTEVSSAAAVIAAASVITLLYNLRGRLFLGDCGAFAVAFAIGLLAIRCHNLGRLPLETALVWFYIPVLDCLRLIPLRLRRHRSPFRPDREHFHYRLSARVGDNWAIAIYAGTVGVTSFVTTLAPQLAGVALALASVVYFGFLLADTLARASGKGEAANLKGNVVALDEKLVKGRRARF
ncbi:MAG TPA: MraY family glycosyltransferase [Rhizomicrobium sp.]|nr:MraY family glycosyltransferase [Rhizomicrobium sp.]